MRVSELLTAGVEKFLALAPETENHLQNKENPHGVTKAHLGLQNITNEKQATDADFRSHKTAAVLDHPDGSVTARKLADQSVTKAKLATGAVGRDALEEGCITEDRLAMAVRNRIAGKVDKEEGMGLSQNSFTDGEKAKLASISLVDGDDLMVDTASLVLKDTPLLLKKEGKQFVNGGETVLSYGTFSEILGTEFDPQSGTFSVRGRNADGAYVVFTRNYKGETNVYQGTANTVCHSISGSTVYFGEMQGNTVTILRNSGSGTAVWKTLTVSTGSSTELWQMFVSYDDIRLVYFSHSGSPSHMYVEQFGENGERKWNFSTYSRSKSNYDESSTIYNRRFRMACMDGKNLYIAPVLDTNREHAVLCIDENGTVTDTFLKLTSFTSETQILQDIFVQGGIIYGYFGGDILRYDTLRNHKTILFYNSASGNRTSGISLGTDDELYAVITGANGNNVLYQLYRDGLSSCTTSYNPHVKGKKEDVPIDSFVQGTNKGIEMLRLNGSNLVSTVYVAADVHVIL